MQKPEALFESYLKNPLSTEEINELISNKEKYIHENAFEKELKFGTGGVREIVEHGTNRLNRFNIARLNLALARTLKESGISSPLVIIAYDSRISSPEFAWQSYHILKNEGISVKIFKRPSPTPLLSFAVRYFNAHAGIVLTASHNPPQYNGYKAYGPDGGQIVAPLDAMIEKNFALITYTKLHEYVDLYDTNPPIEADIIEDEISAAYLNLIQKEKFISKENKKISILYSPLHGTGSWIFRKIFHDLKFSNFSILEEQAEPDGRFPTLKSPNPEEAAAFDLLLKKASANQYDILLASDPDADRVGAAIKYQGGYKLLTGNQICILLLDFLIRKKKGEPEMKNPFICKTIVTTDLVSEIARANGVEVREVLTGFKNIAAALKNDPEDYVFGGEESYGYLPVHWIRDKDSLSSALALCEMAENENLLETLSSIYSKYGYYHDHVFSIKISGSEKDREAILQKLENPEKFIASMKTKRKLTDILDLRNDRFLPKDQNLRNLKKSLGLADVVKFYFDGDSTITIRPSGTEPKIKIYIALKYSGEINKGNLEAAQKELADEGRFLQAELSKLLAN